MKKRVILERLKALNQFLPIIFWSTLILGFEELSVAFMTILTALIHEGGHILFLKIRGVKYGNIRGVVSGFRIKRGALITYNDEIMLYLSGPIANIVFAMIFAIFPYEMASLFATFNLATAISNLLPVEGYDGYGAVRTIIEKYKSDSILIRVLEFISSFIIFSFCILSIYFIDRFGCGYWIFGIFFFSMLAQLKNWLKNANFEN